MRLWVLLLLLFSLTSVLAGTHPVTYQVVVSVPDPDAHGVGVAIGEDVYALDANPSVPLLYSGTAPSDKPYRYVILDQKQGNIVHFEPFERPPIENANHTFHETYGRPWNKISLPSLPHIYNFRYGSSSPSSRLFEEGTIATIHIEANDADIQRMHANKFDKDLAKVHANMTYISYNDIQRFENIKFKVGGHSSKKWAKVPYKLKIPLDTDGLYNRWELKLRSEPTDPTMVREKLYTDLLEASGVLAAHGAYVRLYINRTPVGLYLLMDDSGSESFVRQTIHQGDQDVQLGSIIQGDAGKGDYAANFAYLGENEEAYDPKVYKVKNEESEEEPSSAMENLIEFFRFIKAYDPHKVDDPVRAWRTFIDVDSYLRQLALEWITGNWDAVQYSGNNFALYRDPETDQYIMIPMDFDYTFGNGLEEDQKQLLTGEWTDFTANRKIHSYLWEAMKLEPVLVKQYQAIVREMDERLTNPDVLFPRIDALAYMIQRDVVWDRTLERMTAGTTRPWTGEDFLDAFDSGTGEQDELFGLKEWIELKHEALRRHMTSDKIPGKDDMGVGFDFMPNVPIGAPGKTVENDND